jgi:UDP-3-O-[3-hydroxymyristoyl] glucosamine N-acyltransferase
LYSNNYLEKKYYNQKIFNVNNIKDAKNGEIIFFNDIKYGNDVNVTNASVCITNKKLAKYLNKKIIPIISENPLLDFYKVVNVFYPESTNDEEKIVIQKNKKVFLKKNNLIGDNTLIDISARIGNGTSIGNNVIIGAGSVVTKDIPDNCVAYGNPAKIKRQI